MIFAQCPKCQSDIHLKDPKIGQKATCQGCGSILKVVWLLPIELDFWDEVLPSDEEDFEPNYVDDWEVDTNSPNFSINDAKNEPPPS